MVGGARGARQVVVGAPWYPYGVYSGAVNAFSATRPGSWLVAHVAARVDPALFRWSRGRVTVTGVPTLPMLVLTTTGRRSGDRARCSSRTSPSPGTAGSSSRARWGRHRHPDWLLNLRADPRATVLLPGRREVEVAAVELAPDERATRWPDIERRIPQMRTYVRRTARDLPVVRLAAR